MSVTIDFPGCLSTALIKSLQYNGNWVEGLVWVEIGPSSMLHPIGQWCRKTKRTKRTKRTTMKTRRLSPERHLKCAANFKEMLTYVLPDTKRKLCHSQMLQMFIQDTVSPYTHSISSFNPFPYQPPSPFPSPLISFRFNSKWRPLCHPQVFAQDWLGGRLSPSCRRQDNVGSGLLYRFEERVHISGCTLLVVLLGVLLRLRDINGTDNGHISFVWHHHFLPKRQNNKKRTWIERT